ncbi:MAG: TadE/TadG family type IV pilus assembly protein [Alphaproteobacteria bacterium]
MWRRMNILDDRGGAAVEFALVATLLFFVTFAVIEGSLAAWQWNAVEKAAQAGVRLAAVADPVATTLRAFNCKTDAIPLGRSCSDPGAATFATITCSGATMSCTDGTFDAAAYDAIRDRMVRAYPFLQDQNIVIAYSDVRLGFAGRPNGAIPLITLRLTNIPFNFLILNAVATLPLTGAGPIPAQIVMPDVFASLTAEDLAFEF